MKFTLVAAIAAGALASAANANLFFESENNDTAAAANFLGTYTQPGDSFAVDGRLTVGDVDWFSFSVTHTTQIVAAAFGVPNSLVGDAVMTLLAGDGVTIIAQDDDSGVALFPALEAIVPAGTYYLVMSQYPDFYLDGLNDFTGAPVSQDFRYKIAVGLNIPGPASAALMGVAGLVAVRRRRA